MIGLYKACTGLDDATIQKVLLPPGDVYLSAPEAMKYKICDHVSVIERRTSR